MLLNHEAKNAIDMRAIVRIQEQRIDVLRKMEHLRDIREALTDIGNNLLLGSRIPSPQTLNPKPYSLNLKL